MIWLRIPEEYRDGFTAIRDSSDEEIDELISVFREQPPRLSRTQLRSNIENEVTLFSEPDLNDLLDTLFSLYVLQDDMSLAIDEFVSEIMETMKEDGSEQLEILPEQEEQFRQRLVSLMSSESFDIAARATNLLYEHQHSVHGNMRVLTDIRPIFEPGEVTSEARPENVLVIHTLKISYHERRRIKDFYVAMDSEQVDQLLKTLQRAKAKAGSLEDIFNDADLNWINEKGG